LCKVDRRKEGCLIDELYGMKNIYFERHIFVKGIVSALPKDGTIPLFNPILSLRDAQH